MIALLEAWASREEAEAVAAHAQAFGFEAKILGESGALAVAIVGAAALPELAAMRGVREVDDSASAFFLASRRFRAADSVVDVAGVAIGGERIVVMAGPCAVESEKQLFEAAERVKKCGVRILRAGAYKLRTSPWTFQGLETDGLRLLEQVQRATGLRVVTEVVSERSLDAVARVADLIQVGARNMKSYDLLKQVGRVGKPVLLKRGSDAFLHELLLAAEYLLAAGAPGVVLCERGIRTFADHARNTLDLTAVPVLKKLSHLPVVVDPSHGTGSRDLVLPLSRAAVAVGADGLLVEMHPEPEFALSDGPQALRPADLELLMDEVARVAVAVGRRV